MLIWSIVGIALLLRHPALDRLERRRPFGFAFGLLGLGLAGRFALVGVEAGATERYTLAVVLPFLLLGWLIARAKSVPQRLIVSLMMPVTVLGFFNDRQREAVILLGLLVVMWLPRIAAPRIVVRATGTLAAASLFIYLTHWQVYPHLEDTRPLLATLTSLAAGIGVWKAWTTGSRRVVQGWASRHRRH